jgi:hypothetical protein
MSKPYQNKPFPAAFYEKISMKARHFLCFWCLCNEFEVDLEGWISCTKQDFFRVISGCMPTKTHNPTSILETMCELGIIEFERYNLDKDNRFSTTSYRIRVSEGIWTGSLKSTTSPNVQREKNRKDYYRNRYLERKLKAALEKQT